jgi:hypothetical protein
LAASVLGPTSVAFGQGPDSVKVSAAALVGRLIDTSGAAIADAEVLVARPGDSAVVASGTSNTKGSVTLLRIPAGGPYTVMARKIGYGAARGTIQFKAGDTLYVDFELPPVGAVLAPITVTVRRNRLMITADQFDPKQYRDALDVLVSHRRDMLGDPDRCPLPDIYPRSDAGMRRRPWLDTLQHYPVVLEPDLPYVQQLYVNGVRVDWPKMRVGNRVQSVPGRTVVAELRQIPADSIAEIRYADCWDESVPLHMRYALFVVLKPPSQEMQDSILRTIMKHDSVPR